MSIEWLYSFVEIFNSKYEERNSDADLPMWSEEGASINFRSIRNTSDLIAKLSRSNEEGRMIREEKTVYSPLKKIWRQRRVGDVVLDVNAK
jgi:hypothetical protein